MISMISMPGVCCRPSRDSGLPRETNQLPQIPLAQTQRDQHAIGVRDPVLPCQIEQGVCKPGACALAQEFFDAAAEPPQPEAHQLSDLQRKWWRIRNHREEDVPRHGADDAVHRGLYHLLLGALARRREFAEQIPWRQQAEDDIGALRRPAERLHRARFDDVDLFASLAGQTHRLAALEHVHPRLPLELVALILVQPAQQAKPLEIPDGGMFMWCRSGRLDCSGRPRGQWSRGSGGASHGVTPILVPLEACVLQSRCSAPGPV